MKRILALLLALVMALGLFACGVDLPPQELEGSLPLLTEPAVTEPVVTEPTQTEPTETEPEESILDPEGWYYSAEEVALYLVTYGELPGNFITKNEARELGWEGGSVERWAGEGTAIGGSKFGNNEGLLPKGKGRQYYECDIDTVGRDTRGPKRIVYSNDGLIYYTEDHYKSFELLYGEE